MDFRDIRYFLKVAEHAHLGRAAEELHISQPALSKCIDRLEEHYGVRLFDRAGRGITLTEAGGILRDRYQMLDQDLDDIRREVSSYKRGIAGTVRLGCSGSIASFFLPHVCKTLSERMPDIKLMLRIAMDDSLEDALKAGAIDIIIRPSRLEIAEGIISTPLLSDTVVVMARNGHPLAGRPASLQQMGEYRWVLPTASVSIRQWLENVFVKAGLEPPEATIIAAPLLSAPYILAETDFLTFISSRNIIAGRDLVELRNDLTTLHRHFDISHRTRGFLTPAVRSFVSVLHQEAIALGWAA